MKHRLPDRYSLPVQMVLSFVALVLLTAAAAGLPALLLIHTQLRQQAWHQLAQGSLATQALYAARQNELDSLAALTAQRPTLYELFTRGQQDELSAYLRVLQQTSRLGLVVVCPTGAGRIPVARVGEPLPADLCVPGTSSGLSVFEAEGGPQVWLLASHPLAGQAGEAPATVWVGVPVDEVFTTRLRAETGLEQTLLVGGRPVVTSLAARRHLSGRPVPGNPGSTFTDGSRKYYLDTFGLGSQGIEAEVALEITELDTAQRNLAWTLAGGLVAVVLAASLLGTYLARRISSPLARLATAAGAMSRGDEAVPGEQAAGLDSSLAVETQVREVALVAQALETARRDLKRSIDELRQEKTWTDHLLESIVEGIVTLDRSGRITFFSHGAERITGWQRDQTLGRTCDQVFRPLESELPFSRLIPAPGRRAKIPVELQDGRQAILAVSGARLLPPARGDARVALVFRDVSEEEAVHRLLGRFLANVAHEFRTPLSALAASVELLLDQAPSLSAAELEELLTSLHLGVLGLQTLIDNLLESANIETGHFRVYPRRCNLDEIVAEAIGMMQPLLNKRGQSLVVELPAAIPTLKADPRRMVQVLINLLANANKYGPDDDEIQIAVAVQDRWVRVSIADRGPGVPPEQRKNLFRRFVQPMPPDNQSRAGVGLGLSVVKAVVEAHNGEVGIEERAGGGSVFWFTLPHEDGT